MTLANYAGLLCVLGLVASCVDSIPEAAHQETVKQRHITHTGYMAYQQFVENNQ